MSKRTIKKWASEDRPREKLLEKGKESLSNVELLTILIGNGMVGKSAMDVSRDLLAECDNSLQRLSQSSIDHLCKTPGLGTAKAIRIAAALELGARRQTENAIESKLVKSSQDVFNLLRPKLADSLFEEFWVIYLNRANKIIKSAQISAGGVSSTVADPRKILKTAIECLASGIILCHNHPSGSLTPSESDRSLTKKVAEAAKFIDIDLLDHVIISSQGYYSFADQGAL